MKGEPRYARSDLTLANAFTGARLIMVPIFGYLWLKGASESALWIFGGAAATDVIDGFLARYLNQKSRLGAFLDPLADKLLMLVSLSVGVYVQAIPVWLALCVVSRDALLLLGAVGFGLVWRGRHDPDAWRPTRIGKYGMFLQTSTVAAAIVEDLVHPPGFRPYVHVVMIITAGLTLVAGAQYVVRAVVAVLRTSRAHPGIEAKETP